MKQIVRIFVHPLTIVYLVLCAISSRGYYLCIYYSIGLVHELFHVIMSIILKVKVSEIEFLPFGFIAKIPDLEYKEEWKQFLILIFGPLSYFACAVGGRFLLNLGVLSEYGYAYFNQANLSILIVNLLPIYPLDGEKILENIVSHFINEYSVRVFRIVISFLTLFVAIYMMFTLGNLVSFAFLCVTLLKNLFSLRKDYIIYLAKRNNSNLKRIKIVNKMEIYRFYVNYFISNSVLLNEGEIIKKILLLEEKYEKTENYSKK